ncbi:MAG: ABC transporter permease [Eubacteriales bacterium]|nr:ABC transporter permease [Eubacteriales bacterium]
MRKIRIRTENRAPALSEESFWNRRRAAALLAAVCLAALVCVTAAGWLCREQAAAVDFSRKNLPPCLDCPFGTDWMGRDMFLRTLTGLSLSIRLGLLTAAVSSAVALALGTSCAVLGEWADSAIGCLIDLVLGIPHMLLLVLISCAVGKGFKGVLIGISLTHWTSLARLLRAEALQIKSGQYVQTARKLGKGPLYLAVKHLAPHLIPQVIVGMVLLFPHAILHEASITFLGFGLPPEQPAVGVILSESMKYLAMGRWWLALFPGLLLVLVVMLFHVTGEMLKGLLDPGQTHR